MTCSKSTFLHCIWSQPAVFSIGTLHEDLGQFFDFSSNHKLFAVISSFFTISASTHNQKSHETWRITSTHKTDLQSLELMPLSFSVHFPKFPHFIGSCVVFKQSLQNSFLAKSPWLPPTRDSLTNNSSGLHRSRPFCL